MNSLNILQHTSADYLGLMEDHLEGRRIRFSYFRPFTEQGSTPQAGDACDGLFLLGRGPDGQKFFEGRVGFAEVFSAVVLERFGINPAILDHAC